MIDSNDEHSRNAFSPIEITPNGILIDVNVLHPAKADLPIEEI